jgi:hypothetical protein
MSSSTQVPIVWCTWVSVVVSYLSRHLIPLFPEDSALVLIAWYSKLPSVAPGGPVLYCARLCRGFIVGRQVVKSCLSVAIVMG